MTPKPIYDGLNCSTIIGKAAATLCWKAGQLGISVISKSNEGYESYSSYNTNEKEVMLGRHKNNTRRRLKVQLGRVITDLEFEQIKAEVEIFCLNNGLRLRKFEFDCNYSGPSRRRIRLIVWDLRSEKLKFDE